MEYIAVIDTETNWYNEVMSIGVVVAEKATFQKVAAFYAVFDPEYRVGGMFSDVLALKGRTIKDSLCSREHAMERIIAAFKKYKITEIFAYNANFDRGLLKELSDYRWFDIMRIAAYRQYNKKIPACTDCCKTGKMKRAYGVEPMLQLLSGDCGYREVHNALYDAADELRIMRLLEQPLEKYTVAELKGSEEGAHDGAE